MMRNLFVALFSFVAGVAPAVAAAQTAYVLTNTIPQRLSPSNSINSALFNGDALFVGASSSSRPGIPGTIRKFDAAGDQLLQTINDPQTRGFHSLTFGHTIAVDGNLVATTDYLDAPNLVHLLDATTGQLRHTLQSPIANHPGFGGEIALSGNTLVVGAYGIQVGASGPTYPATVFVFNATTGALLHTISPTASTPVSSWGEIIEISGDTIAIGSPRSDASKVYLYDAVTGSQVDVVPHPTGGNFDSLEFKDGKLLFSRIRGDAHLVDAKSHLLLQTFESPAKYDPEVSGAYFKFAGDDILIGSFGSLFEGTTVVPEARVFDAVTGAPKPKFTSADPADRFFEMSASDSGDRIAIVRGIVATLQTEVQIYTRIPEPGSALLAGIAAAAAVYRRRAEPTRLMLAT